MTRTAALVTPAPWGAAGLDWFDGMAASNVLAYSTAAADPDSLAESLLPGILNWPLDDRDPQDGPPPVTAPGS